MGMSGPSRDGGMMAEINVTPFVDVMLVLLIIFMVTTPLMATGVEIDLPSATAPPVEVTGEQLVIGMNRDGELTLARGVIRPAAHSGAARSEPARGRKAHPDHAVFVQADGTLPYQEVMNLLEMAKQAGIPKVGLVTRPPSEP